MPQPHVVFTKFHFRYLGSYTASCSCMISTKKDYTDYILLIWHGKLVTKFDNSLKCWTIYFDVDYLPLRYLFSIRYTLMDFKHLFMNQKSLKMLNFRNQRLLSINDNILTCVKNMLFKFYITCFDFGIFALIQIVCCYADRKLISYI